MKFKVGDRVKVRKGIMNLDPGFVAPEMTRFEGCTAVVIAVDPPHLPEDYPETYFIDADSGFGYWEGEDGFTHWKWTSRLLQDTRPTLQSLIGNEELSPET